MEEWNDERILKTIADFMGDARRWFCQKCDRICGECNGSGRDKTSVSIPIG